MSVIEIVGGVILLIASLVIVFLTLMPVSYTHLADGAGNAADHRAHRGDQPEGAGEKGLRGHRP